MSLPSDNYIISRNADEAERLNLQHKYIVSCQGYHIHPDIPTPDANARVAELATGTGIWMLELASAHPKVEFHGFDISDKMFPNRDQKQKSLPANVHFHLADVKKPFDTSWHGSFDLVHVRLIQAAMRKGEWAFVLRNLTTLLKPGGWLQWYEDDRAVAVRHAFRPIAPLGVAERSLLSRTKTSGWRPARTYHLARFNRSIMPDDRAEAMNFGYMNLDLLMMDAEAGNLECVSYDAFVIDRPDDNGELRRGWAAMGVSAAWQMIKAREDLGAQIADTGREEWAELAMNEVEAGAHYVSRAVVFTGRKKA